MHALIHQGAAAVQGPGATPAGAGVVGTRAIVLHPGIAESHLAQLPAHNDLPRGDIVLIGAALKDTAHFDLGLVDRIKHAVHTLMAESSGFSQRMCLPALPPRSRHRRVFPMGADANHINAWSLTIQVVFVETALPLSAGTCVPSSSMSQTAPSGLRTAAIAPDALTISLTTNNTKT